MAVFVKKGSLKGPKGDTGENGADGKSVRVANVNVQSNSDVSLSAITPSEGIAPGDTVLDAAGDVYTVTTVGKDTAHVSDAIDGVNLKGPKGDRGDNGAPGAPGKDGTGVTILGSYATEDELKAAHATGNPGDAYLVAGDLYVWDATGAAWKNVGTIQGPQGAKGDPGAGVASGNGAPTGEADAGALYIDVDTGDLYRAE